MTASATVSSSRQRRGRLRSTDQADVVLAISPPYHNDPWLGMGIPVVHGMLKEAGISACIVRLLEDVWSVPAPLLELSWVRMGRLVSPEESRAFVDESGSAFFTRMVEVLTSGSERVFGFSIWRHNLDATLELARRLKEKNPDALVILGGPQAIESPGSCQAPCVDAIVHGAAEALSVPVFRAALDRRIGDLSSLGGVWVNAQHATARRRLVTSAPSASPLPNIDYASIVPILIDDNVLSSKPRIPVLLNLGCPFKCSFCTNTTIYPTMEWGSAERVVAEIEVAVETWASFFPDAVPKPGIAFCDATVNAQPAQWDAVMNGIRASRAHSRQPELHGCMIVDQRVNARRVENFVDAGYTGGFFGLETASQRLRRIVKKPGSTRAVRRGIQALHDGSQGKFRAAVGIIVGHPKEEERDHFATMAFLEWMASLGVLAEINASPLCRTPAAMDASLLGHARGDEFGITWRDDGPAGDPAIRGRRLLSVFEHFGSLTLVQSFMPKRLTFGLLLPGLDERFLDETPTTSPAREPTESSDQAGQEALLAVPLSQAAERYAAPPSGLRQRYEPLLRAAVSKDAWVVTDVTDQSGADAGGVVALFRRPGTAASVAVLLTPRDDSVPAYQRLSHLNLAYLKRYRGVECMFDEALLRHLAAVLEQTA